MQDRMTILRDYIYNALFVLAIIGFIFSLGMLDGIGLVGLLQFGLFMATGTYIIVYLMGKWE
ncbi:MAG: hypothetical protein IJ860_07800 [Eubacterium sp.]|nr:hypothetical protein [Eubacterium sp.]